MELEPFGYVDADDLQEFYSGELHIDGRIVKCELNFTHTSIDHSELEFISEALLDMASKVEAALDAISDDFDLEDESETARHYLLHHFEHFPDESKLELFGTFELENVDRQAFLSVLELSRVGFYPEEEESFLVFDFQFPARYTNHLMAVIFNQDGYLSAISLEN